MRTKLTKSPMRAVLFGYSLRTLQLLFNRILTDTYVEGDLFHSEIVDIEGDKV